MPESTELQSLHSFLLRLTQADKNKAYLWIARASRTYNHYCYSLVLGNAVFFKALTLFFRMLSQCMLTFNDLQLDSTKDICLLLAIKQAEDTRTPQVLHEICQELNLSVEFVLEWEQFFFKVLGNEIYQTSSLYDCYRQEYQACVGNRRHPTFVLALSLIFSNPRFTEFSYDLTLTALCETLLARYPNSKNDLTSFSEYTICKDLVEKSLGVLVYREVLTPPTNNAYFSFSHLSITTDALSNHFQWSQNEGLMRTSLLSVMPSLFKNFICMKDPFIYEYYKLLPSTFASPQALAVLHRFSILNQLQMLYDTRPLFDVRECLIRLSDSMLQQLTRASTSIASPSTPTRPFFNAGRVGVTDPKGHGVIRGTISKTI